MTCERILLENCLKEVFGRGFLEQQKRKAGAVDSNYILDKIEEGVKFLKNFS